MEHIIEGLAAAAMVILFSYFHEVASHMSLVERGLVAFAFVGGASYLLDNIRWRFWEK